MSHHLLVLQGRSTSDEVLSQYLLDTDLEQCLIPRVLELIRSPDGHRICFDFCSDQLASHFSVLLPTDTADAIEAPSRHSVDNLFPDRWYTLAMRKKAKFLELVIALPSADPAPLRYFFSASTSLTNPGICLGHVPGVYTGRSRRSKLLGSRINRSKPGNKRMILRTLSRRSSRSGNVPFPLRPPHC